MQPSIRLLDAYKRRQSLQTDSAAGEALGLSRSAVSLWRKGTSHPDAESIEKMAKAIGEPVGPWLASIEAERARSPANRMVWLRLAATLGTSLALAVTALPSHAAQAKAAYCVKLSRFLRQHFAPLQYAAAPR